MSAYLLGLGVTGVAVLVRWLLDPWLGPNLALVTVFGAVAIAVWYGGYGPALLAAVVGYIACDYLFIPTGGPSGVVDAGRVIGFLIFLLAASAIIGSGQALRVARASAAERGDLLRTTLASIGDGVITTDSETRITHMNGVAEALTGWTEAEVRGQPIDAVFRIVNEDTREPVENPAAMALAQGVIVGLANHTVLIARDGTERPIDDSAAPIRQPDGGIAGCVLVFRDMAERRRAERAIRQRERELSDFFDNASVGLHWAGPDGTILKVNQAELDLLGYEREEYVGRHIAEFHVDQPVIEDILSRLVNGETLHQHAARMRCKDGSIREVLINSNVLWEDGEFIHSRCFTLDITDRRRAEEATRLLAAIVSASDDAIVGKTLDGTILSWNAGAERLFGYTADQAVGRSIDMIIPPDLQHEERMILARLARGERLDHFETVRVTRDGRRMDISLTVSPLLDESGRVVGASKVARDITGQKRARHRLRESEERYRALVESQAEMVCRFRRDGTILFVNGGYARAVGATPEALVGASLWEFVPEADRPRIEETLDRLTPDAPEVRIENRFESVAGERWTLWTNRGLVFDERGRLLEAQSAGIDITERKRVEQALRVSEGRFRLMADAAPVLVWISDTDKLRTWFNRPWLDFVGRTIEEEVGHGWSETVHPDDLERCLETYGTSFDARRSFRMEYRLRRHDGEYRWVLDHGTPLFGPGDEFTGYIGSCIDITERKQAEEELLDADRRKDQFLATLAHELRNPLAPISYSLEILKLAEDDRALSRKARDTIESQLHHLVRLVGDLIEVSRITRGKLELRVTRIELGEVLEQAIEMCRPRFEEEHRELRIELPDRPLHLDGDPVRLAQVFANLLNNAFQYTRSGGRVWLGVERREDEVMIFVRDDGMGIPPDQLESIFEMFAQVDRTFERSRGGLGIGLTLVRQLVELHGGRVTAHSEGEGRGSEFRVRLPVAELETAVEELIPDRAGVTDVPRRRVLVVDDNVDSADRLGALLRLKGHETEVAYDGLAALEAAERFRPEVILLDIGLPKLSGLDVCRRIRKQPWGAGVLLVALTGWGQEEVRRNSKEAGFDSHLVKPVDLESLLRLVTAPY